METVSLTPDMLIVFAVILAAVILFITEWIRVDVVAILIMVALPILGLVNGTETFSGFSSTAVISIIAVIIMGRGLDHTGVISKVVRPLVALAGSSRSRIIVLLSETVAFISSIMQNIGAAALFLPAIRRISSHANLSLSRLLMPVGFAAILGGTITLVGSSPLIMLNDLLAPYDLPPLGLFSVTPIGFMLVATGIGYFIIFGNWVLPDKSQQTNGTIHIADDFPAVQYYDKLGELTQISFPIDMVHSPTVSELCDEFNVYTVAMATNKGEERLFPPPQNKIIEPGSVLAVYALRENLEAAAKIHSIKIEPEIKAFSDELTSEYSGLVEAVVPPHSNFIGKSLGEIHFRHNYLVAPLAVYKENSAYYTSITNEVMETGMGILMHGKWERFTKIRQKRDLIFSHAFDHDILHPQKAGAAIICFALATLLLFFTDLNLSVCLMTGALGMILTQVITIDEAYHSVDWRTVFLLAGLIPLGLATQKTGAAAFLAQNLLSFLGQPSEVVFLLMVGLVTTLFTLVVSNVGATVLLVPLVVSMAIQIGADPRLAAMMVGIAASNSFMLPTHQVNALYMGPGNYSSRDFLKAGAPLSIIFLVVASAMMYFFY